MKNRIRYRNFEFVEKINSFSVYGKLNTGCVDIWHSYNPASLMEAHLISSTLSPCSLLYVV